MLSILIVLMRLVCFHCCVVLDIADFLNACIMQNDPAQMHKLVQDLLSYRSHVSIVKSYVHGICVFVTLLLLDYLLCDVVTPGMYGWTTLGQLFKSLARSCSHRSN